jgi:DNA-binding transcriptional MocR family regulator
MTRQVAEMLEQQAPAPLYERVARDLSRLIERGTFRAGDRIPSVRQMSRQLQVSITTVLGAYQALESEGVIEARPQSGYYVRPRLHAVPAEPAASRPDPSPTRVSTSELVMMVVRDARNANLVQLGASVPDPDLLPTAKLASSLGTLMRQHRRHAFGYDLPPGSHALRSQIARRALDAGCTLGPDELLVTSGAQESVYLALAAACRPGDAVACESPTFYGILQAIDSLGLHVVEIPTHPREGMVLSALRRALDTHRIRAVVTVANFSNPLGSCMPDEAKRELVRMLEARDVALVEDDLNGDLPHEGPRPKAARAWSRKGQVLLCSSFSKTIAPGFRVGWIAPGRYAEDVARLKFVLNVGAPTLSQLAIAEFLADGGYEAYVRKVRRTYAQQVARMVRAVAEAFPAQTKVTRPSGGFVLWVELPRGCDSLELYERARRHGMTIAPGPIFSARQRYRNFVRLNCASWSEQVESAVARLGQLAKDAVAQGPNRQEERT